MSGKNIVDQYSLLHFAAGVTAYFWGISPVAWFVIHFGWETFENTKFGLSMVNKYWHWPGRKKPMVQDSFANSVGDTLAAFIGYLCAEKLDEYGKEHDWYDEKTQDA